MPAARRSRCCSPRCASRRCWRRCITRGDGDRRWLWLSYLLLGAATLTKGPLALLFVTLPLLANALLPAPAPPVARAASTDRLGHLSRRQLVVVPGRDLADGNRHLERHPQKDIVSKVAGASGDPFFMYLVWMLADFFLSACCCSSRRSPPGGGGGRTSKAHALLAVAASLVVYSVFSSKNASTCYRPIRWSPSSLAPASANCSKARGRGCGAACSVWRCCPTGYAAFYAVAEARVLDYRYTAFPQFTGWLASVGETPLYAISASMNG